MPAWGEVRREAPEFAGRVQAAFERNRHMTLATLREDGSPRISGTEIEFDGDDVLVAVSPATHARADARRAAPTTTTIRDVESAIGGLSAGIVERVPIPTIGPAYEAAETGFAAAASLSWIALVLAVAITLGCVALP